MNDDSPARNGLRKFSWTNEAKLGNTQTPSNSTSGLFPGMQPARFQRVQVMEATFSSLWRIGLPNGVSVAFVGEVDGQALTTILHDYLVDGKPVVNPFDVERLPPGVYRLREK